MTAATTPKMRAQSLRRLCAGCNGQIKGKIRRRRCENCYRTHLRRQRDAGETCTPSLTRESPGEVVLASIARDHAGCWLYTGPLDRHGYGRTILISGHPRILPHRAVYQHLVGPIPDGMHLDHTCHEADSCAGGVQCQHRRCVNPAHLEPATPKANNERSNSLTAINARKTHCTNGHEFTPENTRIVTRTDGRTWRKCIECRRALQSRKP